MWAKLMSDFIPQDIGNSSNTSCHRFTKENVVAIQSSKLVIASVGAVASIVVILLIVLTKSYKRFVFRLVIYFMSVNLFQSFADILKVIPVHHDGDIVAVRKGWESVCAVFGFMDQIAMCANDVIIIWIMLYLLKLTWHIYRVQTGRALVVYKIDDEARWCGSVSKLEIFGVFLTVFLPVAYSWIPFLRNMYGLSGLWCWIKPTRHTCDDFSLGLIFMFTVHFGPFLVLVLFVYIGLFTIVLFLCKGAFEMRGLARRQYQRGTKEMIIVLLISCVYALLLALLIAHRIYSTVTVTQRKDSLYGLWLMYTIVAAIFDLMPPFAFLLHPSTWKSMFCRNKQEDDDNTYFSVPPEGDDIDHGIKVKESKPFSSYGSILQPTCS